MSKIIAKELAEKISTGCTGMAHDEKSMQQTFLTMLDCKESAILIKIAHYFTKTDQLMIAIDPTSNTVENLSLGLSKEILFYQEGTLYIAGKHHDDVEKNRLTNQGLFLHGITLFVADVVFKNDFSSLNDLEDCQAEGIDEPSQFLANTAALLSTGKKDQCNPKLIAFYQNQFIPACEERFKQLESQSAINKTVSPHLTQLFLYNSETGKKEDDALNPKSQFTA